MLTLTLTVLCALLLIACPCAAERDLSKVRAAIEQVESGGNPKAHNKAEDAVGILQIRPTMVAEVNRILGREAYTLNDRWDATKSREMFKVYSEHWCKRRKDWSDEGVARRWNGGPNGHRKKATGAYWRKVKSALDRKKRRRGR